MRKNILRFKADRLYYCQLLFDIDKCHCRQIVVYFVLNMHNMLNMQNLG